MISASGVSHAYGRRPVLRDVSMNVESGELVCLIGRNGSGKSTLLKALSGELRADRGAISLGQPAAARPVATQPAAAQLDVRRSSAADLARRRAVLPQDVSLSFAFPVRDVVAMGRSPHREQSSATIDRRVVERALQAVGLEDFADRRFTELSGGERQRVQLARVLAQVWPTAGTAPGVLLLDEPTSALDLAHVYGVLAAVRTLCRTGIGALAVLHDLNAAARFADRVVALSDGVIVADGPPARALTAQLLRDHFHLEADVVVGPDGRPRITPTQPTTARAFDPEIA